MTDRAPWPSEWLRGVLAPAVMRVLASGSTYGYAIAADLEHRGFGAIKGGTLYPLLTRLENSGYVVSEWRAGDGGPGRKYFALSPEGVAELSRLGDQWLAFASLVTETIGPRVASDDLSAQPTES